LNAVRLVGEGSINLSSASRLEEFVCAPVPPIHGAHAPIMRRFDKH
jgi:hypothetical protein